VCIECFVHHGPARHAGWQTPVRKRLSKELALVFTRVEPPPIDDDVRREEKHHQAREGEKQPHKNKKRYTGQQASSIS